MVQLLKEIVYADVPRFLKSIRLRDFLTLIPLATWLAFFQIAGVVPGEYRPSIDVSILPRGEEILFGHPLLYQLFERMDSLVVLAAVPYICHFALPFLFFIYLVRVDGKPFRFFCYFGVLNLLGVLTHMAFPTAPPWYNARFGFEPASYSTSGDPGRLKRADEILGIPLFQTIYGNSPLVFGSFPSLHAGWPFLIAIYVNMIGTKFLSPFIKWGYVAWIWSAAVYLKHHFLLDVLGAALYTFIAIFLCDRLYSKKILPSADKTKAEAEAHTCDEFFV